MDFEKMKESPILYDINEKGSNRSRLFEEYLFGKNHTMEDGYHRFKTSSGEYLYFKHYISAELPGDYMYQNILFEYKSKNDLFDSIPERLDKQIDNILKCDYINQYIIISDCLRDLNFNYEHDCLWFENLKNYFMQYVPLHIHFIPATSLQICFRDMVNIWRCQQSPTNLSGLNYRYELNPFINNLMLLPCLNHNQVRSIFKEFPYNNAWDVLKLTKKGLMDRVKFGKKRCGEKTAEKIIDQINIMYNYGEGGLK